MGYKQSKERNRRLKKLYNKTMHGYRAGAWYNEYKKRFIKYSCHNKWLKIHCRRTIRRRIHRNPENQCSSKGNHSNKLYDYLWELL